MEFASDRLRDNPEIVLAAVQNYGYALEHASDRLRNDPAFVKKAIEISFFAFYGRGESLENNLDILVTAANNFPEISNPGTVERNLLGLLKKMSSAIEATRGTHTPSEIAKGIDPRQGEIDELMKETEIEIEKNKPKLDSKRPGDEDSNPGGDNR